MKKFYYHLAVCLCVIGGLVGCSKEDEPGGGEGAMYQVTVEQSGEYRSYIKSVVVAANGSQTQQAAYKKHLLHNIMDLLVWKSVFSRANRNGLKR